MISFKITNCCFKANLKFNNRGQLCFNNNIYENSKKMELFQKSQQIKTLTLPFLERYSKFQSDRA